MNIDLVQQRLAAQRITAPGKSAAEVVSWMGAMQAQDYKSALWAVGLRAGVGEADVEQAITKRQIIRTWPMRGTLHFVAAEDARWLVGLLAPRIIAKFRKRQEELRIDDVVYARARDLFVKALQGGKVLTRPQMMQVLDDGGISPDGQRGYHLLSIAAEDLVICFGPRQDKQQTFVLFDEWVPDSKALAHDEAMAQLAMRYFTSHGPATVYDFVAWTSLTITEAKQAIASIQGKLTSEELDGQTYWFVSRPTPKVPEVLLLPAFDEMLVGYKDKSALLTTEQKRISILKNGIISPLVVVNGKAVGTWRRSFKASTVDVAFVPFDGERIDATMLGPELEKFGQFAGRKVRVVT